MTVIFPLGRLLTRQFTSKSNPVLARLPTTNAFLRASYPDVDSSANSQLSRAYLGTRCVAHAARTYATEASSTPASRPKAHTGRTTARKTATGTKPATTRKTPAKASSTKKAPVKKPKTKTKAKAKPKPKPKTRKKAPPGKTALNRARIDRAKAIKQKALLDEPKLLPQTAYTVYFTQERKGATGSASNTRDQTRDLAIRFKQVTAEELEKLNHTANQNKSSNEAAYKKWVSQYTPEEIKQANDARRLLKREKKVKEGKAKASAHLIKDDRLVKKPRNAYLYFHQDRFASGDFKHMALPEAAKLCGREWKALSSAEKKPYEDQAKADTTRYLEESRTVYGIEPQLSKRTSTA